MALGEVQDKFTIYGLTGVALVDHRGDAEQGVELAVDVELVDDKMILTIRERGNGTNGD